MRENFDKYASSKNIRIQNDEYIAQDQQVPQEAEVKFEEGDDV